MTQKFEEVARKVVASTPEFMKDKVSGLVSNLLESLTALEVEALSLAPYYGLEGAWDYLLLRLTSQPVSESERERNNHEAKALLFTYANSTDLAGLQQPCLQFAPCKYVLWDVKNGKVQPVAFVGRDNNVCVLSESGLSYQNILPHDLAGIESIVWNVDRVKVAVEWYDCLLSNTEDSQRKSQSLLNYLVGLVEKP